jgi:hypothetical protein
MLRSCTVAQLCCCVLLAGSSGLAARAATAIVQTSAPRSAVIDKSEACLSATSRGAPRHCYADAAAKRKPLTDTSPQISGPGSGTGTWRLLRTPNPSGGRDAVSIAQAADILRSDVDLAGLMLRCSETGVEVLVVLTQPLPLRARPNVTVEAAGETTDFTATVAPPGAAVLLPKPASTLAAGAWQTAAELSVQVNTAEIEGDLNTVRGIIPLSGLSAAFPLLLSNCPSP